MTSWHLFHRAELSELTPQESEARWQRHVIIFLWFLVGATIVLAAIFLLATGHGLFQSSTGQTIPSWPDGMP